MCNVFWHLCGSSAGSSEKVSCTFSKRERLNYYVGLPKDTTPFFFFFTLKPYYCSQVFILIFVPKQRVAHNDHLLLFFCFREFCSMTNGSMSTNILSEKTWFRAKRGRRPSGVSGIVLKKKKMDEKKRYHDDDDDDRDVFCTPLSPLQIWKKVSIFEENFETHQKFLDD